MTIAELIKELEIYSPNAEIRVSVENWRTISAAIIGIGINNPLEIIIVAEPIN